MTEHSIIPIDDKGFVFNNYTTLEAICKKVLDSGISKLGNIQQIALVVVKGRSLGLDLFDALENIHVINNRTTLSGDLAMFLVERSGLIEDKEHVYEGEGESRKCTVTVTRKGRKPKVWSFSMPEAKKAGLLDRKSSPWITFPDSMLYYRALGFALRREFPDVLRGQHLTEEFDQLPEEKSAQASEVKVAAPPAKNNNTVSQVAMSEPDPIPEEQGPSLDNLVAFAAERGFSREQLNDVVKKLRQANSLEELSAEKIELLIKHWSSVEKSMGFMGVKP
jgi:hypothetical protein